MLRRLVGLPIAVMAVLLASIPGASPIARAAAGASAGQSAKTAATPALPELVYICPMPQDYDVVQDKPGKCPKCGMALQPIRITIAYSCLNNTAFIQETPGKCRTDGTDLVQIAASMYWTCPGVDKKETSPGKCADGKDRVKRLEPRPHGDHNPRHGGLLFMAPDAWHHLEGTYPSAGLFRVFFYDEWTKPMRVTGFSARAFVKDAAGKEVATIPLKAGRMSNTMEARLPGATRPLTLKLGVTFKPGDGERLFDFQFQQYTKEPVAAKPASAAAGKPAATAPGKPTATPAKSAASTAAPVQAAEPAPMNAGAEIMPAQMIVIPVLPNNSKALLAELATSSRDVEELIKIGQLPQVWVPALRTKDIAVALEQYMTELPDRQRALATSAVNRLIRAAYQMDLLGDLGDMEKIKAVHVAFAAAVTDLSTAYAPAR